MTVRGRIIRPVDYRIRRIKYDLIVAVQSAIFDLKALEVCRRLVGAYRARFFGDIIDRILTAGVGRFDDIILRSP